MKPIHIKRIFVVITYTVLSSSVAHAQLNQTFANLFSYFLKDKIQLSGQFHGGHFLPAANLADSLLTPALNTLMTNNIASFPLSSTGAGVTYDFSTGKPVSIKESLGPIFAETAETIGKFKLNVGFNYSYLNLTKFRGISTKDMRFTFVHEDVEGAGLDTLGVPGYENDYIDLYLDLDVNAHVFAFYATFGLTNKLDLGVAVPVINMSLSGNARASITSFTYGRPASQERFEGAAHRFGGTLLNPILDANTSYDQSTTGLGDVALRLKYSFLRSEKVDLAALADVRLPTGKEEDFLGRGKTTAKVYWIMSRKMGDFTPHLNLGYDYKGSHDDSNELQFVAGFDQKIGESGLTFAAEALGTFDLNTNKTIELFPGSATVVDQYSNSLGSGQLERKIDLSNIPDRTNDNTLDVAMGFRYAPSEDILLLGNIIVPVNDGGLRSSIAPTFGLAFNL